MAQDGSSRSSESQDSYVRRVLLAVQIIVLVGLLAALLISAANVLLLLFAGALIAVFLRGCGDWIASLCPLSPGWSAFLVFILLVLLIGGGAGLIIPHATGQMGLMSQEIGNSLGTFENRLQETEWGRELLDLFPDLNDLPAQLGSAATELRGIFSTTVGALASIVLVLFIGLYLCVNPSTYTHALVLLFPERRRFRVRQILRELQINLTRWLLGRLLGVIIVGVATWIGLMVLGIPLALSLAVLAAGLSFIPNLGPVLSVVPAALIALTQGPNTALWVLVLYMAIQAIESYLFTPLIAKRAVSLPPVLTIVVQIVMGAHFGILGLLLAGPLATVLLVLVRMMYIEDVLGTPISLQGDGAPLRNKTPTED